MYKNYEELINTQGFEVVIPEIYTNCIPKYYTQNNPGDLPMMNGIRVSWEDYLAAHPEAEGPVEFVPEMVYTPQENNLAHSSVTAATIIDLIYNNVEFSIRDPENTYPEVLDVLRGYSESIAPFLSERKDLDDYMKKVKTAYELLYKCYTRWQTERKFRATSQVDDGMSEFDKIEAKFK